MVVEMEMLGIEGFWEGGECGRRVSGVWIELPPEGSSSTSLSSFRLRSLLSRLLLLPLGILQRRHISLFFFLYRNILL